VLGANIGTCVTALLASVGANENSKRVAFIHFTFNVIGTVLFTVIIWIFREPVINLLVSIFPASDAMSLQMRVSLFHVIFNVTTTVLLLPFVQHLVKLSQIVIKDKEEKEQTLSFKFVDERLLSSPTIALMQVKKEIEYMANVAKENLVKSLDGITNGDEKELSAIYENEKIIDFTNKALTKFLIKLSVLVDESAEKVIGSYFHVLNDLERVGDHAENFYEIGVQMKKSGLSFSDSAKEEIGEMYGKVFEMFDIAVNAFDNLSSEHLDDLTARENEVDALKKKLNSAHVQRLASGDCSMDHSPYFFSAVAGLERVADHLVNVGYSILNPTGSQTENN